MASISIKLSWAQVVKGEGSVDDAIATVVAPTCEATPQGDSKLAASPCEMPVEQCLPTASTEDAVENKDRIRKHDGDDSSTSLGSECGAGLKPGKRGDRLCWCRGEFLVMLGNYGWILSLDEIDHPDVGKNGGRIYIQRRDLVGKWSPKEGDIVGFYLYADQQGLGAEACRLEHETFKQRNVDLSDFSDASTDVPLSHAELGNHIGNRPSSPLNASAAEFVPSSTCAQDHGATVGFNGSPPGRDLQASPFQRMLASMINPAYLLDDSDSEDDDSGSEADAESNSDEIRSPTPWSSQYRSLAIRPPPGLSLPPGLDLPLGFRRSASGDVSD